MTEYQKTVVEHMATAPQELREYVCGRLTNDSWWTEGYDPIIYVNFVWDKSEEGIGFWVAISSKRWDVAMATDFWQSRLKAPSYLSDRRAIVNDNDLRQQLAEARLQLASVEKKCAELEARLRSIGKLADI